MILPVLKVVVVDLATLWVVEETLEVEGVTLAVVETSVEEVGWLSLYVYLKFTGKSNVHF